MDPRARTMATQRDGTMAVERRTPSLSCGEANLLPLGIERGNQVSERVSTFELH